MAEPEKGITTQNSRPNDALESGLGRNSGVRSEQTDYRYDGKVFQSAPLDFSLVIQNLDWMSNSQRNIPLDSRYHYGRFTNATLEGLVFRWKRASDGELQCIYDDLLAHFAATADSDEQFLCEQAAIRRTWPRLTGKLKKLRGAANFMREYGVHSRFFYPFLLDVPTAVAMLPAHGIARDVCGVIRPIPVSDAMYRFCLRDEVFTSVRFRRDYSRMWLETAKRPVILGAGLMPEYFMYQDAPLDQEVVAYDLDATLMPVLQQLFGRSPMEMGIDYRFESFERAFQDETQWGKHDLVLAQGVASYFTKRLEWFIAGMARLMSDDGTIVFDMQVMCSALYFDALVLGWKTQPALTPAKSRDDAIEMVRQCADKVGLKVCDCAMSPNSAAGIVFRLAKH